MTFTNDVIKLTPKNILKNFFKENVGKRIPEEYLGAEVSNSPRKKITAFVNPLGSNRPHATTYGLKNHLRSSRFCRGSPGFLVFLGLNDYLLDPVISAWSGFGGHTVWMVTCFHCFKFANLRTPPTNSGSTYVLQYN